MMMRSAKKDFDEISALQAACDSSIALVAECVYPREGYESVTPLLVPCGVFDVVVLILR